MPKLLPCPSCGFTRSWSVRRHHRKCKKCRSEWSANEYYPVNGFRFTRREWQRLLTVFLRDERIKDIERECHVAYRTAYKVTTTIRMIMAEDVPELLLGVCKADETYVGGSWKNKAIHIRRQGTKRGRGTSKQPIFGIVQRPFDPLSTSVVRVWLTPDTKSCSLNPHIKKTVCRGTTIYTDGRKGYRRLPNYGYLHD